MWNIRGLRAVDFKTVWASYFLCVRSVMSVIITHMDGVYIDVSNRYEYVRIKAKPPLSKNITIRFHKVWRPPEINCCWQICGNNVYKKNTQNNMMKQGWGWFLPSPVCRFMQLISDRFQPTFVILRKLGMNSVEPYRLYYLLIFCHWWDLVMYCSTLLV